MFSITVMIIIDYKSFSLLLSLLERKNGLKLATLTLSLEMIDTVLHLLYLKVAVI